MRFRFLAVTALAGSIALSGCVSNNGSSDDTGTALLIGAAVVGLGVLAATASDDDDHDDDDRRRYASSERRYHRDSYGNRNAYRDRGYANNGRCDDPSYRTSNGGRAERGTDERDCRRYGDGRR